MKSAIRLSAVLVSAFVLTGARVNVKPIDGNGETSAPRQGTGSSSSEAPRGRVTIRQGAGGSRAEPRQSAPTRPTTGRGIDGRGRGGGPVRVRPSGRDSLGGESSRRAIGMGRTRIIRDTNRPAPERHGAIARNTSIIRDVQRLERTRVVPNRNYWHESNGVRYCHTYRNGIHWYGFYHGPHFYWTRYHRDRWWWYDHGFGHWVFWANGHWWWPGPGGATYVYIDNAYYRPDAAPVDVDPPAPVEDAPGGAATGGEWTSPDKTRMVQVHGPQSEAFLYDTTGRQPVYMGYLGKDVSRVRFSGGKDGKALKILVDFIDGEFAFYSADGEPLDVAPPPVPEDAAEK